MLGQEHQEQCGPHFYQRYHIFGYASLNQHYCWKHVIWCSIDAHKHVTIDNVHYGLQYNEH